MSETTYLASPATSGYTEERQAEYNDDGTMREILIFVHWDNGTHHSMRITFAGPPDYTFSQFGGLAYPDGSRTGISVPPDGTLHLDHQWEWRAQDGSGESQHGTDEWVYQRDGAGTFTTRREFTTGNSEGIENEQHAFDRDGALIGDVTISRVATNQDSGEVTDTSTTITLEGVHTIHTVVRDADGNVISDTTEITHDDPVVEPDDGEPPTQPTTSGPPSEGPTRLPTSGGGRSVGRIVTGGRRIETTSTTPLCQHWTDYYVVEADGRQTYLNSRFRGVGLC